MDHDQRFKVLLQEFLAEFFALFFPVLASRLDFTGVTWLQQELFPDPPRGKKRTIDLIARIPVLPSPEGPRPNEPRQQTILLHIEIESDDTVEPFRGRMYDYYHHLTRILDLDVLPIAIYLRVGLQGQGIDRYERRIWDRRPLCFEYDYVGLPALPGPQYLAGTNALGVAWSALMRWPREQRVQAALEAVERIVASPETPQRKMLLCECVQAYAPLDDTQRIELTTLLEEPKRGGTQTMIKTWTEQARESERRELIEMQLEERFGQLSELAKRRLAECSMEKLKDLGRALIKTQSLRELGLED